MSKKLESANFDPDKDFLSYKERAKRMKIFEKPKLPSNGYNVDLPEHSNSYYFVERGMGWPRRKTSAPMHRAHRRAELTIYLRLLDAKAAGATSKLIRTWIEHYHGMPPEAAQKALDTHWAKAKRMAEVGYLKLAASL